MKKFRFWLFLTAIIFSFSCSKDPGVETPDPVTSDASGHKVAVSAALSELQSVLSGIDGETRSGSSRRVGSVLSVKGSDVLPETRSGEDLNVEDLVYIANFENGEGYAILGADDRLASVIAITDQGSLTAEEFAAAARGEYDDVDAPPVWPDVVNYARGLGGFGDLTGGIDTGGQQPPTMQTYDIVGSWENYRIQGPYIAMKWDQSGPYNYYAPVKNKVQCPVGCVPVAAGQMVAMNYYKKYNGSSDISRLPTVVHGYTVDWNVIFKTIDSYVYPDPKNKFVCYFFQPEDHSEEALNVASLLAGIGLSVDISYGADGSGASSNNVPSFFKAMGFSNSIMYDFSEDRVFSSLSSGYPVYANGHKGTSGHAWVLDGYLQQRKIIKTCIVGTELVISTESKYRVFYHCNFGWRGDCDGYYAVDTYYSPKDGPVDFDKGDWKQESSDSYPNRRKIITCYYY